MEDLNFLIGKTITGASFRSICEDFDDVPYLDLTFSDGTECTIESKCGGWTGKSEDEYTRFLEVSFTTTRRGVVRSV